MKVGGKLAIVSVLKKTRWAAIPLERSVSSTGGRNRSGRITVRGRGARRWRKSCQIDWFRRVLNEVGELVGFRHDSSRTGLASMVFYKKLGLFSYLLAAEGVSKGGVFVNTLSQYSTIFRRARRLNRKASGNSFIVRALSIGSHVFGLEAAPGRGGVFARAAGASMRIMQKIKVKGTETYVALRLRSGQTKYVHGDCRAVLGQVSNVRHRSYVCGKAGHRRNFGFRSKVRGVAMNPIDHPHGGGEGKTSGGRPSVSPWGWLTKGRKTTSVKVRKARVRWVRKLRYGHKRKKRQQINQRHYN